MIGLKKGMVELKEHNPEWIILAKKMKKELSKIFPSDTKIEHIGSTSIPSIKAKAIIDIAVGVSSFDEVVRVLAELASKGFDYKADVGDESLMYFNKKNSKMLTTYHLHVLLKDSQNFKNHLYFRDYLKSNKALAGQYESLKMTLASKYTTDRDRYTKEKTPFIQHIIRKAQVSHFLGKKVTIKIDRPIGSLHPKHQEIVYPINYGYIPGEFAPDDEELDVYLLGVDTPVETYKGNIIAIIHRENDAEDKLVMSSTKKDYTISEIKQMTHFQEQFYDSRIELYSQN